MKVLQRIISCLLAVVLVLGMVPVTVVAVETVPETMVVDTTEVSTEPAETQHQENSAVPQEKTEATTEPTQTTVESTEVVTEPTVDSAVPDEEPLSDAPMADEGGFLVAAMVASGECGENLAWTLDENGTLTISGTGEFTDCSCRENGYYEYCYSDLPWEEMADQIKSVVLEEGITTVCMNTFKNCVNLKKVKMPSTVTVIGYTQDSGGGAGSRDGGAFMDCPQITSVGPVGSGYDYEFAWTETIPDGAFALMPGLKKIIMPQTITTIENGAFYGSKDNITSAGPIGSGCGYEFGWKTEIAERAFSSMPFLETVVLPETLTSIAYGAFEGCGNLKTLSLPENLISIGNWAFNSCSSLKTLTLPESLEQIGESAFSSSGLESIVFPGKLTCIPYSAFSHCDNLKQITIPETVAQIDTSAFYHCSALEQVEIRAHLTTIPGHCFTYCENLKTIVIPGTVMSIEQYAFSNCNSLTDVYFKGTYGQWEAITKGTNNEPLETATIHFDKVDAGTCGEYTTWQLSQDGTLTISGQGPVTERPWHDLLNQVTLTQIIIEEGVTEVGVSFYHSRNKVEKITVAESVSFTEEPFFHMDGIETAGPIGSGSDYEFGWKVRIPSDAFKSIRTLKQITWPEGLQEIGDRAFWRCSALEEVQLPDTLTHLGVQAFAYTALKQLVIPENVTCCYAVVDCCEALTDLTILGPITILQNEVDGCTSLKTITLPRSLKYILENTFSECYALTDIYFAGTEEEWNAIRIDLVGNERLFDGSVTIHYGWNAVYLEDVRFYDQWDAVHRCAYFGPGDIQGCLVTEETDTGFTDDPTRLLGQYVLVTVLASEVAGTEKDVLLRMEPVKSYIGLVSEADADSMLFQYEDDGHYYGYSYQTPPQLQNPAKYLGKTVLYHLAGSALVGISDLQESEAYLTAWDPDTQEIRVKWDGTTLTASYTLIDAFRPQLTLGYNINAFKDVLQFLDSWDGGSLVIHYLHDDHGHIYDARGEIVDGSFSYIADWGEIASYPFHYDESWFDKDSLVYQHDLARMSLRAAMAAGDTRQLSDKAPYTNIQNLMETLGFDFSETLSQYPDPEYDSIGFAMGHKEIISTAGEHSTLVMVAVRGIGYGAEWGGNFRIGYGITEHEGFKIAADAVLRGLDRYLYELRVQDPDRNIKVWISGFSRGGATTNLVAARLVDGKFSFLDPKDVYAFCFACPKNTTDPNVRSTKYQCIANFINPIDFVPYVAMEGLDFDRYGTDYILPNIEKNDNYQYLRDQAHDVYYSILKEEMSSSLAYELATEYMDQSKDQAEVFRKTADHLASFVINRLQYTLRYEELIMGLFASTMGKGQVENPVDYLGSAFASVFGNLGTLGFQYLLNKHFIEIVQEGHLTYAHMPTLYLAWMDSLDNLDDEDEGRTSRRLFVNCPVDVAVYRDGTLVGQILGNVPTEIEGGILTTIDENGQKVVVLPGDAEYDVCLTATGDGEMTYTVTERNGTSGNTTRVVSYCDIPIREGDVLNAEVQQASQNTPTEYSLTLSDGTEAKPEINLSGSEITQYTVTVLAEGSGNVSGGGRYLPGEYARVCVSAEDMAYFVGWFADGVCVSKEAEYRFLVNADTQLTAKFAETLDALHFTRDYILMAQGQSLPLSVTVSPEELSDRVTWYVEDPGQGILSIDESGTVQALAAGTAYVVAAVSFAEKEFTTRCRVDVAEPIQLEGIQLGTTKLTTELYSTEYALFNLLLKLPQNISAQSADQKTLTVQNGVAIQDVCFRDAGDGIDLNRIFDLVALDDRRIAVVPTQYALDHPKELTNTYKGVVSVTVNGVEYTAEETLTLTVKKNTPKLKAKIGTFNAFCTGQTQEIAITGGTVTGITARSLPYWLTLNADGTLSLTADAPSKASGKAVLQVETTQWRIPAEVSLSVKTTYKAPGLKLSASSVKLSSNAEHSSGVSLKLLPKSKKDTLVSLDVTNILAPDGYCVENFNVLTGNFLLKAQKGFQPGKITLLVKIEGTERLVSLPLTVKIESVKLKTSVKSLSLNTELPDVAAIGLTATPADYQITQPVTRLTDSKGADKTGELEIGFEDGNVLVSTTDATPTGASYKLYISAGGSKEAVVTIKTVSGEPSVSFKSKATVDLSFPDKAAEVKPTFKNYNGTFTITGMTAETSGKKDATEQFRAEVDSRTILVSCAENTVPGSYTLKLKLTLPNGDICENSAKVTVKRTAVKLKLSATKLTLNKAVNESASVNVTCTTKGYAFTKPVWELSAPGKLDISYFDGALKVAANAATQYGATYKILVKANAAAPAATLTVTIPAQNKSNVTASLKASGKLDVIRSDKGVTVTPSYKNIKDLTGMQETLMFYSSADNYTKAVNDLFRYEPNGKGGYTVTRAEGNKLDHNLKYKAELVSSIGGTEVRSSKVSIKVTMGSAKLTVQEGSVDLFAKDKNDRAIFHLTSKDAALNTAERVQIKDAKYKDLFEIYTYGNGEFAIGFKNGKVSSKLTGKTTTVTLNVWVEGNQTEKVNTTVKLKLNIVK